MQHVIDAARVHHDWDRSREPTLRIASGDEVRFDLRMAGYGQVEEGDTAVDFDLSTLYHMLGPVFVEGARPGDTLRVEVLELTPGPWGWTTIQPGQGLLGDDFDEIVVRTFDLRDGSTVEFTPDIRLPIAPFLGTMGVHPGEPEVSVPFPPHRGAGNIDTRHLTVGSTLLLPIWCEGALFSCGDPHAAQGDGEVCVTAIECAMQATLRLSVEQRSIPGPQFFTAGPLATIDESAGHFGAMGIDADLMEGARTAVRSAIDWLVNEHGLTRVDAYMLCSLAGDLKILEIVDFGVWNVGFTLPLSLFNQTAE